MVEEHNVAKAGLDHVFSSDHEQVQNSHEQKMKVSSYREKLRD